MSEIYWDNDDDFLEVILLDGAQVLVPRSILYLSTLVVNANRLRCFCGVGSSYKTCCRGKYGYDYFHRNAAILNNFLNVEPDLTCAFPTTGGRCGCKTLIKSHSAQLALLKAIADVGAKGERGGQGHVLTMHFSGDRTSDQPFGRPVGIKDKKTRNFISGSIFFRFCADHDTEAFRSIEEKTVFTGRPEQFVQIGYRAAAFEDYVGRWHVSAALNMFSERSLQGWPGPVGHKTFLWSQGPLSGVEQDVYEYEKAIFTGDHSAFDGLAFEISGPMGLVGTGHNWVSKSLHSSKGNGRLGFGIMQSEQPGNFFIVITWKKTDVTAARFVKSIAATSCQQLPSVLFQLIFSISRNIYFSGRWADSLEIRAKKKLSWLSENLCRYECIDPKLRFSGYSVVRKIGFPTLEMNQTYNSVNFNTQPMFTGDMVRPHGHGVAQHAIAVMNGINILIRLSEQRGFIPKYIADSFNSRNRKESLKLIIESKSDSAAIHSVLTIAPNEVHDYWYSNMSSSPHRGELEEGFNRFVTSFERAIVSIRSVANKGGLTWVVLSEIIEKIEEQKIINRGKPMIGIGVGNAFIVVVKET